MVPLPPKLFPLAFPGGILNVLAICRTKISHGRQLEMYQATPVPPFESFLVHLSPQEHLHQKGVSVSL